MNDKRAILLLQLRGPLQSWGSSSKWDYRNTDAYPTKSGIVGMIGCACGIERGQAALAEISSKMTLAIRADRPGSLLTDFHTIMPGNIEIKKADGGIRTETIVSRRQYLCDACFLAALTSDVATLESWERAFCHPVWPVYLGRKSCVPTVPVCIGITWDYASLEEVMEKYPCLIDENNSTGEKNKGRLGYLMDCQDGGYFVGDELVDSVNRVFGIRQVRQMIQRNEEVK